MVKKKMEFVETRCDWCGRDMSHERYGDFVRGLDFIHEGIDLSGSGGIKVSYPDLCLTCSSDFLDFVKSHKA